MKLVTRAQWGARPRKTHSSNITPANGGVVLHYEGPKLGTFAHSECPKKIRGIQNYHMDNKGWADIAYSYMVCPHGAVFECRGMGVRTAAQGTNEGNQNWYAICVLMGQGDPFTDAAKLGINEVITYLFNNGTKHVVKGHRDFHSTACPGSDIYAWIKAGRPVKGTAQKPPVLKPPAATPRARRAPCPYPRPKRILRPRRLKIFWPKGEDVKWVQWHLKITEDGVYGPKSYGAVSVFQKQHGLKPDGIVGRITRAHLNAFNT